MQRGRKLCIFTFASVATRKVGLARFTSRESSEHIRKSRSSMRFFVSGNLDTTLRREKIREKSEDRRSETSPLHKKLAGLFRTARNYLNFRDSGWKLGRWKRRGNNDLKFKKAAATARLGSELFVINLSSH